MQQIAGAARWVFAVEHWTLVALIAVVGLGVGFAVGALTGITPVAKAPRLVVTSFYEAAQEGDFAAARGYLSNDAGRIVDALPAGEWESTLEELTRARTVTETEFLSVKNYGKRAVVGVLLAHSDGEVRVRVDELVRQGAVWRIEWPVGTREWVETVQQFEPWYGR